MGTKRILFIPDTHVPYHHKPSWNLMLRAARGMSPDVIVILGDFADLYSCSRFDKDPRRRLRLEEEAYEVNCCLDELDELGASRKIFVEGNHEFRLERLLKSAAPGLVGSLNIDELFHLKERKWKYVPYQTHCKLGETYLTHDVGHAGVNAVRQTQAVYQASVMFGHTHKIDYRVTGNAEGKPQIACTVGWLGDPRAIDYKHQVKALRDYNHGFGEGILESNGTLHIKPCPIIRRKVWVGGELYK